MTTIANRPDVLTMIHVYETTPATQQAVYDGLIAALDRYGSQMAGHISSNIHKSIDGMRVTSYSQWDRDGSKALFENPTVLQETMAAVAPYVKDAAGQDSHLYNEIAIYTPVM